jgi:hypothetical protein
MPRVTISAFAARLGFNPHWVMMVARLGVLPPAEGLPLHYRDAAPGAAPGAPRDASPVEDPGKKGVG